MGTGGSDSSGDGAAVGGALAFSLSMTSGSIDAGSKTSAGELGEYTLVAAGAAPPICVTGMPMPGEIPGPGSVPGA